MVSIHVWVLLVLRKMLFMTTRVEGALAHAVEVVVLRVEIWTVYSLLGLFIACLALVLGVLFGIGRSSMASNAHKVS